MFKLASINGSISPDRLIVRSLVAAALLAAILGRRQLRLLAVRLTGSELGQVRSGAGQAR